MSPPPIVPSEKTNGCCMKRCRYVELLPTVPLIFHVFREITLATMRNHVASREQQSYIYNNI